MSMDDFLSPDERAAIEDAEYEEEDWHMGLRGVERLLDRNKDRSDSAAELTEEDIFNAEKVGVFNDIEGETGEVFFPDLDLDEEK